jgi:DNA-binding transcriptional MerR regulator
VSVDTLRYYERARLMLDPVTRASSNHRRYSEREVRWVVTRPAPSVLAWVLSCD